MKLTKVIGYENDEVVIKDVEGDLIEITFKWKYVKLDRMLMEKNRIDELIDMLNKIKGEQYD